MQEASVYLKKLTPVADEQSSSSSLPADGDCPPGVDILRGALEKAELPVLHLPGDSADLGAEVSTVEAKDESSTAISEHNTTDCLEIFTPLISFHNGCSLYS